MYENRKIIVIERAVYGYEDTVGTKKEVAGEDEGGGQQSEGGGELECLDEGGSSGRLTTMFGSNLEWSATGRQGASLLDITKGDFSRNGFERCKSRMEEMMSLRWMEKADVGEGIKGCIRRAVEGG